MTFIRRIYLFLALYLPFESYLAALVFRSETGILAAKQITDGFVLLSFLALIGARLATGKLRMTDLFRGCLLLIIVFILFAIITTFVNGGSSYVAVLQIKSLLRYVFAALVIANIGFSPDQWQRFIRLFSIAAVIYMALGAFQILLPDIASSINPFNFIAQNPDSTLVSTSIVEAANGIVANGAALNTIEFAYFLAAWWVIWVNSPTHYGQRSFLISLSSFFAVEALLFFSESKGAVLTFTVPGIMYFIRTLTGRNLLYTKLAIISVFLGTLAVAGADAGAFRLSNFEFFNFTTSDYVEIAKLQRLGIVLTYFDVLTRLDLEFFIGFGAEPTRLVELLYERGYSVPYLLTFLPNAIEDVYWVATMLFYGVLGGGLLLIVHGKIYLRSLAIARRSCEPEIAQMHFTIVSLMILIALAGFFNQIVEIKQFSYYFWMLVGYSRYVDARTDLVQ